LTPKVSRAAIGIPPLIYPSDWMARSIPLDMLTLILIDRDPRFQSYFRPLRFSGLISGVLFLVSQSSSSVQRATKISFVTSLILAFNKGRRSPTLKPSRSSQTSTNWPLFLSYIHPTG
jgi:hypothetical protein